MEPKQGVGRTLGRLERQPVCSAADRKHGKLLSVHLQEIKSNEQRAQGDSSFAFPI